MNIRKKAITRLLKFLYLIILMAININAISQGKLTVASTAFTEGNSIPEKFTCAGKNISPPLSWSNAPAGTKSFALIMDDPDAPMGVWVHWVLYNIPANVTTLKEDLKIADIKAIYGLNDWRSAGYGGPCPPNGQHRYIFKLYALDTVLESASDMTKQKLEAAMKGHILAKGELMGTFAR